MKFTQIQSFRRIHSIAAYTSILTLSQITFSLNWRKVPNLQPSFYHHNQLISHQISLTESIILQLHELGDSGSDRVESRTTFSLSLFIQFIQFEQCLHSKQ